MSTSSHIAFFGATGDCAGYCLADCLNAGIDCSALARTPAKLTSSMKAKGVSDETLDRHLTIIAGDVKDIEAVKRTLAPNGRNVCDKIVFGIGGYPKLQWSLITPCIMDDPRLCQDACTTILEALHTLKPAVKPTFIAFNSTGMQSPGMPRDLPLALVWIYEWLGQVPHADKRALQANLAQQMLLPEADRVLAMYVQVKAALLVDGCKGLQAVRDGVEDEPPIGYTIARADVGAWTFRNLVNVEKVRPDWVNKSVVVTS